MKVLQPQTWRQKVKAKLKAIGLSVALVPLIASVAIAERISGQNLIEGGDYYKVKPEHANTASRSK